MLLRDRLPAYISWAQFERNQDQLQQNRSIAASPGTVRRGRALLAGLVVCGRCGSRLATRYQGRASQPNYSCCSAGALHGEPICQTVAARVLDEEVARLAMLALAPSSVEVSLRVADDVDRQRELAERHWKHRLERARIEADRVRRQFERVEPENRLVARTLERDWEEKLSALQALEAEHAQFERSKPRRLRADEQAEIQRLAADLPGLWRADSTTDEDRKTILRQIVERIVVAAEGDNAETEWVELRVHWAGGQETYSRVRRPIGKSSRKSDWPRLLARLQELKASGLPSHQIAARLQEEGFRPARARRINAHTVRVWLCRYGDGVRERETIVPNSTNEWTLQEVMARCGASSGGVRAWIDRGAVQARRTNGRRPRWIITATPAELDALAARLGRRRRPLSADESMYAASPPKTDR